MRAGATGHILLLAFVEGEKIYSASICGSMAGIRE